MILESAEYIGIAAFSASGFYIGRRNNLDLLGLYIASFLTALGGGITRDMLVGRAPITFVQISPSLIVLLVSTILIVIVKKSHHNIIVSKSLFILVDAVGMVSFSISGAITALHYGFNLPGVTIVAFITAIGGGIFRDILINQVPYVLKGGFYGVISLGIGISIYLLDKIGLDNIFNIIVIFFLAIFIRMYAYHHKWHLLTI